MYSERSELATIVLIQEEKRGIDWRDVQSNVCLIVDGLAEQVAKVVSGREDSLSMSGLPSW